MKELPIDTLRAELARQVAELDSADQLRVLELIDAMQRGAEIDAAKMQMMGPAELREWADQLSKEKD